MKSFEIKKKIQKVDNVYGLVNLLPYENPEMLSHWAKYLCVVTFGLLESSIKEIYGDYAKNKSNTEIHNFVRASIKTSRNPSWEEIISIARKFNVDWGENLQSVDDQISSSVNSVVSLRNRIAHGEDTNITLHSMKEYYKDIKKAIQIIEENCL